MAKRDFGPIQARFLHCTCQSELRRSQVGPSSHTVTYLEICFCKIVLLHLVAMVFPVVMYGCESWTAKKAEH